MFVVISITLMKYFKLDYERLRQRTVTFSDGVSPYANPKYNIILQYTILMNPIYDKDTCLIIIIFHMFQ